MDITYIPMARGFIYLAAVLGWFTRRVVAWRVLILPRKSGRGRIRFRGNWYRGERASLERHPAQPEPLLSRGGQRRVHHPPLAVLIDTHAPRMFGG